MSFGSGGSDVEVTGKDLKMMMPSINAGGLRSETTTVSGMDTPTVSVDASPNRQALIDDISSRFRELGAEFGDLRKGVAPGFSKIRKARLNAVNNARRRSQQNLSGNFARRRLGGSSFAADTLIRSDREFGEAAAAEESRTFMEEMAATTKLIQTQGQMDIASFETMINEMNLQTSLAQSIVAGAQGSIGGAVTSAKQLEASRRAGELSVGEFFSGLAAGAATNVAGNFTAGIGPGTFASDPAATTPSSGAVGNPYVDPFAHPWTI